MNIRTIFSIALLTLATCGTSVVAQTYTLGFDEANYTVGAGDVVTAQVILTEQIMGTETARLAAGGDNGLFAFAADVDFSSFTGGSGSTFDTFALEDTFAEGFAGSGEDVTVGPSNVSFEGTESFTNNPDGEVGVGGVAIDDSTYVVVLGTFTFNAGAVGSVTTLQLGDHVSPAANQFLFGQGATPDINFSSSIITVAVPEPGSAAVLALLGCAGFMTRRRK